MEKPQVAIQDFHRLKSERSRLNHLWEEIAEVLAPERVGFMAKAYSDQRASKIFDTTPNVAKRGLVNAIGSMLRPKSAAPGKWFDIVPEDEDLMSDNREVKEWIEMAEDRLWEALYNPRAKFIQATGEIDDDLITFGTAAGYIGVRDDQRGFNFRSFHMADTYIDVDSLNDPNAIYISEKLTAYQAADRWGEENLGEKTREALKGKDDKDKFEKFEFLWCVKQKYDRDPRIKHYSQMPFQSTVVDVDSEHQVLEEGFPRFPFFIPRWDTRSGEVYGRGVGVLALPSVLTLNQMGKTMLRGLHRAVDPAWLLPADSMVSAPQLAPGGVGYYDAKAIRNLGMSKPFQQMGAENANIPWGLNAQQAGREQILALFYRNILNLPIDAPQMTATEVIARREEFIREIGAVFGNLESSYSSPVVEQCFELMLERGAFGPPETIPEELQGSQVRFRFASPVEKAKRQIEEATVVEGVNKVLQMGQVQPDVMLAYDWQEIGKFIAEANDFPPELILDAAAIKRKVQEAQAAAAQEQSMQMMERGANIAGSLPGEVLETAAGGGYDDMAAGMMGGMGGV